MNTSKTKTFQGDQIIPNQKQMPKTEQNPYLNKTIQTMRPIFWTK